MEKPAPHLLDEFGRIKSEINFTERFELSMVLAARRVKYFVNEKFVCQVTSLGMSVHDLKMSCIVHDMEKQISGCNHWREDIKK